MEPLDARETFSDATLDHDRARRCGFPEVIYGEGKTPEQVARIATGLLEASDVMVATRVGDEHAERLRKELDDGSEVLWFSRARLLVVDRREGGLTSHDVAEALATPGGSGHVVVCCAGTSDLAVAEEAALTARVMGSRTTLFSDVGVAGVHRILAHTETLRDARVVVAVAGMEGALPSLIAGLVDVPVVAVPTSVGYGVGFGGIAALLGMLTSCAGGVSVVNIDNGFGAGQIANRINRPPARFAADFNREDALR